MATFQKIKLKQFAQVQDRETSEARFWKNYKIVAEEKLQGAANCIHFDPSGSGHYLVTGSTRVSFFDGSDDRIQRAYTRFKDDAFSGKFRRDGRLLVAGDKAGYVKVFDVQSKAVLRQLKGHSAAVRSTTWTADALHMLSGSDDKSVKIWDLGCEDITWEDNSTHSDYIRSVCASTSDNHMILSGSYDHTVALYDTRQSTAVMKLNQGTPVTTCLFGPSSGIVLSAGGNEIKVWDILSGGRLLHTFSNHQKDITDLVFSSNHSRLFSSGLDGHVKIYDFQKLQVVHGIKYDVPVMSVALSPDSNKMVVGFVNGNVEIKKNLGDSSLSTVDEAGNNVNVLGAPVGAADRDRNNTRLQQAKFYKGAGAAAMSLEDNRVETERLNSLRPYELLLKKFNYQGALDAALKTRNPLIVVTILEELCRRSGLVVALSGRDEVSLEPILSFLARYASNPRYARLVVQVAHVVLDLYAPVLGRSDAIDELFLKLHKQVRAEVSFQRQIMRVMGSLDGIITSAMVSQTTDNNAKNSLIANYPLTAIEN